MSRSTADTMRAVRGCGQRVQVVDVPRPSGDGVLVDIVASGICGSDLHLLSSPFAPSATLGHEISGRLSDGTPVAIEPMAPCGSCEHCSAGHYNHCQLGAAMSMGVGQDGGMAEQIRVPQRAIVPLPSGLPLADACLIEPLAVAYHGLRLSEAGGGTRVAVIGGGSIGLCAVAVAESLGGQVTLLARHEAQRQAGQRLGAKLAAEGDYDLVIDAAGSAAALQQAVSLARPGATLLLLATYWEGLELPGFELCMKEIRVIPSSMYSQHGATRDVDRAASILAANPTIAEAMITHRFPLDAAAEAFATAADRASGAIKVVLEP